MSISTRLLSQNHVKNVNVRLFFFGGAVVGRGTVV